MGHLFALSAATDQAITLRLLGDPAAMSAGDPQGFRAGWAAPEQLALRYDEAAVKRLRDKIGADHPLAVAAARHVRADCDTDPMPLWRLPRSARRLQERRGL